MEYFYFFPLNEKPYFKLGVTNDIETRMNTHKREFAKKGFTFNLDEVAYYEAPNRKITEKIIEEQFKIVYSRAVDWSEEIFLLEHLTEVINYCEDWGKRMGLSDQRKYTPIPKRVTAQKVSLPKNEKRKHNPENKKWTPLKSYGYNFKPHESDKELRSWQLYGMRMTKWFLDGTTEICYLEPNTDIYRYYYSKDLEFGSYSVLSLRLREERKDEHTIDLENREKITRFIKDFNNSKHDFELFKNTKYGFGFTINRVFSDKESFNEYTSRFWFTFSLPDGDKIFFCEGCRMLGDRYEIHFLKSGFYQIKTYYPGLWEQLPLEIKSLMDL